jgi:hypothetical protein
MHFRWSRAAVASFAPLAVLAGCSTSPEPLDPFGRPYSEKTQIREMELKDCQPSTHDTKPQVVRAVRPTFPLGQYYAGNRAVITVTFVVKPDGTTQTPATEDGELRWFKNHALLAVADWRFKPATKGGDPIAVSCSYTFIF